MLALAVAYEVQCRFTAAVSVMPKGFNHFTQLAMSMAASTGRLFGLSPAKSHRRLRRWTTSLSRVCKSIRTYLRA
jgi:2-methylcitrate dehydratase PrpD